MKIPESGVAQAYELAKMVYCGDIAREEALSKLQVDQGLNRNTAGDLIQNYKCMINGVRYTRCNNSYTTEYYLNRIKNEFGNSVLAHAVTAVTQHLDYYEDLRGIKLKQIRKIRDKYSFMLKVEDRAVYPDDLPDDSVYEEGSVKRVFVNVYERNKEARAACLKHYGYDCFVCGFNFEKQYGELGKGLIHVHHLVEISSVKGAYSIDPVKDLRPVCPNCHMIIHSKVPAYSIEDGKSMLTKYQG